MNVWDVYAGARLGQMASRELRKHNVALASMTPEQMAAEVAQLRRLWRIAGALWCLTTIGLPLGLAFWFNAERFAVRKVVSRHVAAQRRITVPTGTADDTAKVLAEMERRTR